MRTLQPTVGVAIGSYVLDVTWLAENTNLLAGCEGVPTEGTGGTGLGSGAGDGGEQQHQHQHQQQYQHDISFTLIDHHRSTLPPVVTCFSEGSLKPFMALGQTAWRSVRDRIGRLLASHQSATAASLGPSPLRDDRAYARRRAVQKQADNFVCGRAATPTAMGVGGMEHFQSNFSP